MFALQTGDISSEVEDDENQRTLFDNSDFDSQTWVIINGTTMMQMSYQILMKQKKWRKKL